MSDLNGSTTDSASSSAPKSQPGNSLVNPTSTAMPSANTRRMDGSSPEAESVQFIDFAKKFIPLLASVTALPILSTSIGGLEPPNKDTKLTVLSSLLCLITFASCWLLKSLLAKWSLSKSVIRRTMPFYVAAVLTLFGLVLTTYYTIKKPVLEESKSAAGTALDTTHDKSNASNVSQGTLAPGIPPNTTGTSANAAQTNSKPSASRLHAPTEEAETGLGTELHRTWNRILLSAKVTLAYLLIFPTFVLALGVVLVTCFLQQSAQNIQSYVEAHLSSEAEFIMKVVQNYAQVQEYLNSHPNHCLKRLVSELSNRLDEELESMARAQLLVASSEIVHHQSLLYEHFKDRFDAVSDRDLDFWCCKSPDEVRLAEQYLRLNIEAVNKNPDLKSTRIFIFAIKDFRPAEDGGRLDDICKVLRKHTQAGIGWGIVPYEQMNPDLIHNALSNDFALFCGTEEASPAAILRLGPPRKKYALTLFQGVHEGGRRFHVLFDHENKNSQDIKDYQQQYQDLLAQCWMVSGDFLKKHEVLLNKLSERLKNSLRYKARSVGITEESVNGQRFLIEVSQGGCIQENLKTMQNYLEVSSEWLHVSHAVVEGKAGNKVPTP